MNKVNLLGVEIDIITSTQINNEIDAICKQNKKEIIANSNINALNIAYSHVKMKYFLNRAAINFIDGDGINWGLKLTGQKTGPKVTYDWWIWELGKFCSINKLSWYLLGATQKSIEKAVENINEKIPTLDIKGYHNGFFNRSGNENQKIIDDINSLEPNILITGMGMPIQEYWLIDNWAKLNVNVALTGGAVIDYLSGELLSTPAFFRKIQLEWFFRFVQKPKYFFSRYVIGNPMFFYRLFKNVYL